MVSSVAHADTFDHPVFAGQVEGVFKEMKSWFEVKPEPVKVQTPVVDAVPVPTPVSKVTHVEVSNPTVAEIRDKTCAKPNGVCFTETLR